MALIERLPRLTKLQVLVNLAGLFPLAWLLFDFFTENLTVNPIQAATLRTGKYALIFLILSLACTPLNTVLHFRQALRVRRALGLYAFFYAGLHFVIFTGVDYGFDPVLLREAIFEKRYALIGFSAFLILLPLAITSTRGWMKRLGKNWTRLHRLIYLAALLVIVHYVWLVKSDIRIPILYGIAVIGLLILRIPAIRRFLARFSIRRITNRSPKTLPGDSQKALRTPQDT